MIAATSAEKNTEAEFSQIFLFIYLVGYLVSLNKALKYSCEKLALARNFNNQSPQQENEKGPLWHRGSVRASYLATPVRISVLLQVSGRLKKQCYYLR